MTTAIDEARYAELLKETHPHVIRSEAQNEAALHNIELMMERGDSLTAEERELLALLVALVERYEDDRYMLNTASPHDVLVELMAARNLKPRDIVSLFSSKGIASEVLAGKRSISKAQAKRLATYFGVSPALFI